MAITDTKEYRISDVKRDLIFITFLLDSVSKSKKLQNEIYYWSVISERLLKVSFWSNLHILIEEDGLIDKKLFYSDPQKKIDQYSFYLNNGTIQGTQILRNIIEPYLK